MFEDTLIEFEARGNRRVITDVALAKQPSVIELIRSFPKSFEYDYNNNLHWYVEPEDAVVYVDV